MWFEIKIEFYVLSSGPIPRFNKEIVDKMKYFKSWNEALSSSQGYIQEYKTQTKCHASLLGIRVVDQFAEVKNVETSNNTSMSI